MASPRYTLNITPDVPEEVHIMTPKEKRANFWFYYKWHIIIGIVLIGLVFVFVHDIVTQVKPDYTIGVLSPLTLPAEVSEALSTQLAAFCDDRNGDGKVTVTISEYSIAVPGTEPADPQMQMAGVTRFSSDSQTGECMIYLTQNAVEYEEAYTLFAYNDGTEPAVSETENGYEVTPDLNEDALGAVWGECPALTSLDMGDIKDYEDNVVMSVQDYLKDFRLLRRVHTEFKEKTEEYYQQSMSMFEAMTAQ